MNRLFWGIALIVLVASGGWAQSTWRGQAEIWATSDAPADGFVAASNEFPRNSLLSVENYKTRKTIQVRVVSALPSGATALVLLNPKAAQALDIKTGEIPLVGVRVDPTGVDRPDNPDPDVNPLAGRPGAVAEVLPKTGTPSAVTPTTPVASVSTPPAPTLAPEAKDTTARTPSITSLDVSRGATTLDPDLLPLPALAAPEAIPEPAARTPLAVSEESETPVTPGRKVFVTTRDPDSVASEAGATEEAVPAPAMAADAPATAPEAIAPSPTAVAEPQVPVPVTPATPVTPVTPVATATTVATVPVKPASSAWVSVPGKLEGPILGAVPLLSGLEKGKSYVQVGAWASEAAVLSALGTVKSYVPLALYQAVGEKNPWRVVVPVAPKGQLGVLLMHFRSQGFRSAGVVKG